MKVLVRWSKDFYRQEQSILTLTYQDLPADYVSLDDYDREKALEAVAGKILGVAPWCISNVQPLAFAFSATHLLIGCGYTPTQIGVSFRE